MKTDFAPLVNKIYTFEKYSVLFITKGQGVFQVDFRNYEFGSNKAIFLSPGQYFQLLSGSFDISLHEFPNENIRLLENSRVLFKHLVSVGHIDLSLPKHFHLNQLEYLNFSSDVATLLATAIDDWIILNPFNASEHEINLLFDLKDIIDENYREPIYLHDVSRKLREKTHRLEKLSKEKLHQTIHQLTNKKLLLESQRKVVFTNLSTKEIAYELGFKDPAYFNRFFKLKTLKTPWEFRQDFDYAQADTFINDLFALIDSHYKSQRFANFYSNQLSISVNTLNRKIQNKLGVTLNQLIKERIMKEAIRMLHQNTSVRAIAFELGFAEANHFSTFFKNNTGKTPTQFSSHF